MSPRPAAPERGDLVWIDFDPQAGHEQAGRRPGMVLSPYSYNARARMVLVCPITARIKGYPFEVRLPEDLPISGVVLADQIKCLDWEIRQTQVVCRASEGTVQQVLSKLSVLLT